MKTVVVSLPAISLFLLLSICPSSAQQFLPPVHYNLFGTGNGEPQGIATADFNHDGYLDLAVGDTFFNATTILLNNRDGSFRRTTRIPFAPISLAAADVNGDGNQDLIAVGPTQPGILEIFLGDGTGNFQRSAKAKVGKNPIAVTVADFDGDGKLDFATADSNGNSIDPGSVTVLLGDGSGGIKRGKNQQLPGHPWGIVAGDFNGDGHPDLAIVKNNNSAKKDRLSILLNNGDGSFQPEVRYPYAQFETVFVATADLNHDGKLDLVLADNGEGIDVTLGNGDGTFAPQTFYPTINSLAYGVTLADFNLDGNTDLAVAYCSCLLYGNGDGTFQPAIPISTQDFGNSIVAGDFDLEGAPDIAMPLFFNGNQVSVLLNAQ